MSRIDLKCLCQMLLDAPSALCDSDMSYILPELLLRVTQKPKSHLETFNEPILVTITSGNEADHWAGRVKRARRLCGLVGFSLLRIITDGLVVRDRAC